jgi:AcrR family transcriptional regulator
VTSARERLLNAANELFYAEGVQTVGIDRIIERAGVAKASLYNTFGSKDELVRAYLRSRHDWTANRLQEAIAAQTDPVRRLLAPFHVQAELFGRKDFHGCPFVGAAAEAPAGGVIEQEADEFRADVRALFTDLARDGGAADPETLGSQLQLIYDGAIISAQMDRDPSAAVRARTTAEILIRAALQ